MATDHPDRTTSTTSATARPPLAIGRRGLMIAATAATAVAATGATPGAAYAQPVGGDSHSEPGGRGGALWRGHRCCR